MSFINSPHIKSPAILTLKSLSLLKWFTIHKQRGTVVQEEMLRTINQDLTITMFMFAVCGPILCDPGGGAAGCTQEGIATPPGWDALQPLEPGASVGVMHQLI